MLLASVSSAPTSEWAELASVVIPGLITLAAVYFTLQYNRGKEIRDMRRGAYIRWLQFVDSLGSWGYEPQYAGLDTERQQAGFRKEVKNIMAELELVASRSVWLAVNTFFQRVSRSEFQDEMTRLFESDADPETIDLTLTRLVQDDRVKVLFAMRRDIGTRTWLGWISLRWESLTKREGS